MLQRSSIRPLSLLFNYHSCPPPPPPPPRSTTALLLSTMSYSLPKITLTRNEQELADLLVGCADWIDENPLEVDKLRLRDDQTGEWIGKLRGQDKVELRIAGGWVRDKLLGKESDDIDISTSPDPITGLKFATLFENYLSLLDKRELMGKLTKIEAKPEQSKHLETATAKVCQLSVDWVQQRGKEVYSPGSRIPIVQFGTPLEDAERRDLTINALFYNLRTREIEDQTGKGLSDLGILPLQSKKRIRTPLEPFKTFQDDPLRIIRAVRFAARFGREFELDQEMVNAIHQQEIRKALLDPKKISRERVGAELEKILLGKDPQYGFELIESLNLHPLVFLYDHSTTFTTTTSNSLPPPPLPNTFLSVTASNILTRLINPSSSSSSSSNFPPLHPLLRLQVINPPTTTTPLPPYPEPTTPIVSVPIFPQTLKRLYLSCGLLPLYDLLTLENNKGNKQVWIGEKVIREGIKGPLVDIGFCKKLREGWNLLSKEVNNNNHEEVEEGEDRVRIGMLLRNPSIHDGQHMKWNVTLFWSLIVDLVYSNHNSELQFKLIENYNSFVSKIQKLELDTLAFSPPLLDGKSINKLLPFTKSSPAMVTILQSIISRQLKFPGIEKQELEDWVLSPEVVEEFKEMCEKFKRDRNNNASNGNGGVKRKGGE
ncbi:hypothetical protein JCM3765_002656 [Sporobolomyces pararoseus]